MNARAARLLNLIPRGNHAADLPGEPDAPIALSAPVAAEPAAEAEVDITDAGREALARIQAQVAADIARLHPPVAADLAVLIAFRDTVRSQFVRAEPHHGCGTTWPRGDGTWTGYAAIWQHRTGAVPEPDYDLGRYDGTVSDVIAGALAKADAEWAARKTEDAPEAQEHEGRHAGRRAAWTEVASS